MFSIVKFKMIIVFPTMNPVLQFQKGCFGELINLPAKLVKVAVTDLVTFYILLDFCSRNFLSFFFLLLIILLLRMDMVLF